MALSAPSLLTAAGNDGQVSAGSDYVTASITPTANAFIVVAFVVTGSSAAPTITSVIGNGITYDSTVQRTFNVVGTPLFRLVVYKGSSASPSTGTIAIKVAANATGCTWSVFEFTGHNPVTPEPQHPSTAADATTPIEVTMGAFVAATSGTLLMAATDAANTYTDGDGMSSVSSTTGANPARSLNVSYLGSNVAVPTTTPNTSPDWGVIGMEIAEAVTVVARRPNRLNLNQSVARASLH